VDSAQRIRREIEETTGTKTSVVSVGTETIVFFVYEIPEGKMKGQSIAVGISMQGMELYPVIPPHFIHVPEGITDGQSPPHHTYSLPDGRIYHAFSRPVGGDWDRLPEQNMKAYLEAHMPRFWRFVQ